MTDNCGIISQIQNCAISMTCDLSEAPPTTLLERLLIYEGYLVGWTGESLTAESNWPPCPSEGVRAMPLSQFEREVLLFNMRINMVPEGATPQPHIDMARAMEMIVAGWRLGQAKIRVGEFPDPEEPGAPPDDGETTPDEADDSGKADEDLPLAHKERPNLLQILDVDWEDDGVITVLLSHGDARAADPALLNFESNEIRTAGKTDDDGLAHAVHLMLGTHGEFLTRGGSSRALLERAPSIGRSNTQLLFNKVLRSQARDQRIVFVDDDRTTKRCHPRIASAPHASRELREDLEAGGLTGIDFTTSDVGPGFDGENIADPEAKTLKYKMKRRLSGRAAVDFLVRAATWGSENNYNDILVHFRDKVTNKDLSQRFRADREDARELIYARHEPIRNFNSRLVQHPEKIVPEIQQKMRAVLGRNGIWT